MRTSRVIVLAVVLFAGGLAIGAYGAMWLVASMLSSFSATSAVAGVSTHVAVLQSLRNGDVTAAITLLETLLDGDLMSIGAHPAEDLPPSSENTLRRAAEYRAKYPRENANADVQRFIDRGLQKGRS